MAKKILISAGEISGDIYGSLLARELKNQLPDIQIYGAGGERMQKEGVNILDDTTKYSTVGLYEAIKNAPFYIKLFHRYVKTINSIKPDLAVLIDLPDFNFRLGRYLVSRRIPVFYYVSPQIWAWRSQRVWTIKKIATRVLVIFDFEVEIYKKAGIPVEFVGHPILDWIQQYEFSDIKKQLGIKDDEIVIGLLPGSRQIELDNLLPIMIKSARIIKDRIPESRFLIALPPDLPLPASKLRDLQGIKCNVVYGKTYDVFKIAKVAIISSGTATLEAAVFGVPMVVTYYVNPFLLWLIRPFLKVKRFAMVNLLADKEIIPECYQNRAKAEIIASNVFEILKEDNFQRIKRELELVKNKIGSPGASKRAAEAIIKFLK